MNRTSVFIACNKAYFKYAITTLLSYKRFRPEFDYFIVSEEQFNDDMKDKGVLLLQYDFSDVWNNEGHKRNLHCFWNLSMPFIFKDMGYNFSMSIDADTLCIDDPWPEFSNYDWSVAAVKNSGAEKMVPNGLGFLNIDPDTHYDTHIHTAVVWYNHRYADQDFTEDIIMYYKWLQQHMIVKHDQQLLCLFLAKYADRYKLYQLPLKYNFFFKKTDAEGCAEIRSHQEPPIPASIVHFQGYNVNPWSKRGVNRSGLKGYYIGEYRKFYKKIWGERCPVE